MSPKRSRANPLGRRPAVEDAAGDPFTLSHEFVARLFDVPDRTLWLPPLWLPPL